MCTVSIKVNDDLLHKAWGSKYSEVDMAEWMQQQIEAILVRMALSTERKSREVSHLWDDYELSPEILAMAPEKRQSVYSDYKAELSNILEEKYK